MRRDDRATYDEGWRGKWIHSPSWSPSVSNQHLSEIKMDGPTSRVTIHFVEDGVEHQMQERRYIGFRGYDVVD